MSERIDGAERTSVDPVDRGEIGQTDALSALTANLSETAQILFSAGGVHNTLEQVVAVAVHTIE